MGNAASKPKAQPFSAAETVRLLAGAKKESAEAYALVAVLLGKMVAMTLSQELGFLGGKVFPILFVGGAAGVLVTVGLSVNPQRSGLSAQLRHALLAILGFGLAGMSASFGGWPAGLAVVAGLGGAAILVALGIRYAPVGGE